MNTPQAARAAWWLRAILVIVGATLLCATVPVFFPVAWMQALHEWLGLGVMPTDPVVIYLARSTSLLYAMHGMIVLVTAIKFRELQCLVPWIIALHAALGLALIIVDWTAGMPTYWTLGEGPGILAGAVLCLALWRASRS
ncbi:MAG: hypothetical protein KDA83_03875 [Planctomycetales bacterium]|nr:hypothetical protein [Planctomycetales bacterium]